MAVDLPPLAEFFPLQGIAIASHAAGIRYSGRDDIVLFQLARDSTCAGVFTTNTFAAAPVHLARAHLARGSIGYWLVNAGNANAATGQQGLEDALRCCAMVARCGSIENEAVLPFSTGVIGEPLPLAGDDNPFSRAIPALFAGLREDNWDKAARAIMTTDTVPKGVSIRASVAGGDLTINGIVKGSGMIHPNMATMLSFLATDITISKGLLQELLRDAVDHSFHCITVDGDTSTNDAVVIAATGKSQLPAADSNVEVRDAFAQQLRNACESLAQSVVRDAEGANRFVNIQVQQAETMDEARRVAKTIALSPLVKTALFAGDPNWGRIVCAIGYAGVDGLDSEQVSVSVNGVSIVRQGCVDPSYSEAQGNKAFAHHDIDIRVALGRGTASGHCLTCDLGHDYVTINAEYRS